MSAERPAPSTLPSGYRLRHPTTVDLPEIQRLVDDCESLDCGESHRSDWNAAASFAVPVSAPHENWWLLERGRKALGFARVDPDIYVVAWDGDDVAGQALAMPGAESGAATIHDAMVRRPWRGRGLGLALLLEVFARLYQLGRDDVSVWVDAENETGAVQLYGAAGMSVWRSLELFRLDVQPSSDGGPPSATTA